MILYIEKQAQDYEQTKKILSLYKNADIILIDHYKNIFDKSGFNKNIDKSIIIAKLNSPAISEAPENYGHNNEHAYFFKTSLNCIYDCTYCYLKGAFKNDIPVYFVNYDEIKKQIEERIKGIVSYNSSPSGDFSSYEEKNGSSLTSSSYKGEVPGKGDGGSKDYELQLKSDYTNAIWFYSSDYSDILGMDPISGFLKNFVPFFEELNNLPFPKGVPEGGGIKTIENSNLSPASRSYLEGDEGSTIMMEVRSKSANIKPILDLGFVPQYTEFAFSLNPQELIDKYETGTSSLAKRITAINELLDKGYKVGLRFLPLLPVKNYKEIYTQFVKEIGESIDMSKISSSFASGLLYTKKDYKVMLKKYPKLDVLYRLKEEKEHRDPFIRESREVRNFFYDLFRSLDDTCYICLDDK